MGDLDKIYSILRSGTSRLRADRSIFIGEILPVSSNHEATDIVSMVRKRYPDASHRPYAYRIFDSEEIVEYSTDDGEPPGTAGYPILESLRAVPLINTLLVVTRYFGGKKLGTRRLRQTFAEVAGMTLGDSELVETFVVGWIELRFPFDVMAAVEKIVRKFGGKIEERSFDKDVRLKIGVRSERVTAVMHHLEDTLRDRGKIRLLCGTSLTSA